MPEIIFNTIKPDRTFYLRFDVDNGSCVGVSTIQKGNCIEISEELADDFNRGKELMSNYSVVFEEDSYVLMKKEHINTVNHLDYCKNLYRIFPNTTENCIRFVLDMDRKEWFITMDQPLRKQLKKTMTFENYMYEFFVVDQNDYNILYYSFKIDLLQLISAGHIKLKHNNNEVPALLCRKVFNYSLEVKNAV